jgi:5'-deoxynucleotidase YfbR-like HD superfamily hydrolase
MIDKIEFFVAGSETERYHTVRTIQRETVGHHSHGVAMYCWLLSGGVPSAELLMAALVHDLAEHVLGDLPSPAKKKYGIGQVVNELEETLLSGVGMSNKISPDDARRLKLADIFQGMTFCIREVELGNKKMVSILRRYMAYAEGMLLVGKEQEIFNELKGKYNECRQ